MFDGLFQGLFTFFTIYIWWTSKLIYMLTVNNSLMCLLKICLFITVFYGLENNLNWLRIYDITQLFSVLRWIKYNEMISPSNVEGCQEAMQSMSFNLVFDYAGPDCAAL
jgi:hypothetical protein